MKKYVVVFTILTLLLSGCANDVTRRANLAASAEYIDLILSAFSANNFSSEEVSDEAVRTILKAGIQAPSIYNSQICRFTVINNTEIKNEILPDLPDECVFIIVSAPMVNQFPAASGELMSGIATESMYMAAQAIGLGARIYTEPVAKINYSLKEKITLPSDYEAITLLVVGHVANFASAVSGASIRKEFNEFVNYVD